MYVSFKMSGMDIELKDSIRYLCVELSSVLGFCKHIIEVSNKAVKAGSALDARIYARARW